MEHVNESYLRLKKEVDDFRGIVLEASNSIPTAEQKYKGCYILYSPLNINTEVMFIGINPGAGFYNSTGIKIRDTDLEPTDTFEYLEAKDNYDYTIASETREVFEKSEHYHLLENCVKTNIFYFATSNQADLFHMFSELGEEINSKFHFLSKKWTMDMIKLVNPKVILCEGKLAMDLVSKYYEQTVTWNDAIGYFEMPNKTLVVGYKRRYSNIQDKEALIDFLKNELKLRVQ